MSDPKGPGGDDWGFPEVDPAGPASTVLPPPEPAPAAEFDTGSDAWWRAQAQAQRSASEAESPDAPTPSPVAAVHVAPPELVQPSVLSPSPLDLDWVPDELPAAPPGPAEPTLPVGVPESAAPVAQPQPVQPTPPVPRPTARPPAAAPPVGTAAQPTNVDPTDVTDPTGFPALQDDPVWTGPPQPSFEDAARTRTPVEPERVGPARALAGAALAVAGVALGIGALLLLGDDEPKGTPAVTLPSATAALTTPTAAPTPTLGASPTAAPSTAPTASAAASPTVGATSGAPAAAPIVPVTVLNNSRITGLAERSAARFRDGGWPVPQTGNYRGTIAVTTVYFAPGEQASAQRFASQFGIDRVAPRFAGLPGSGTTVVLTRDYA